MFFIVGSPRSGTTLLRTMLDSHPAIWIPPEAPFIVHRYSKYQNLSELGNKEDYKKLFWKIVKAPCFKMIDFIPSFEKIWANLKRPSYASLMDSIFNEYILYKEKTIWGSKTPIFALHISLLCQLFPQAKYIHLVRDGRDVAASCKDRWGSPVYYTAIEWMKHVKAARQDGAKLPKDQYFECNYEDLISNPKIAINEICQFLRIDFSKQCLEYTNYPHDKVKNIDPLRRKILNILLLRFNLFGSAREKINTTRVERWKNSLSSKEIEVFEYIAGELLQELGYELSLDKEDINWPLYRTVLYETRSTIRLKHRYSKVMEGIFNRI